MPGGLTYRITFGPISNGQAICDEEIANRELEFLGSQGSAVFHATSDRTLTIKACACRLPHRYETRQKEVKP